jgi:hypothetical protein
LKPADFLSSDLGQRCSCVLLSFADASGCPEANGPIVSLLLLCGGAQVKILSEQSSIAPRHYRAAATQDNRGGKKAKKGLKKTKDKEKAEKRKKRKRIRSEGEK